MGEWVHAPLHWSNKCWEHTSTPCYNLSVLSWGKLTHMSQTDSRKLSPRRRWSPWWWRSRFSAVHWQSTIHTAAVTACNINWTALAVTHSSLQHQTNMFHVSVKSRVISHENSKRATSKLTLWRALFPYGYSYKASGIRPGYAEAERQSDQMSKITNDSLTWSGTGHFIVVPVQQHWAPKCWK